MEKFANFCFIKNITKKRIFYKLKKIEKKYELSNKISNYYINQWIKYINDEVICYLNVPENIRTVNSIEIFNRYFHKKCNGKGLVTIYELLDRIKEEYK